MKNVKMIFQTVKFTAKKYSPEILLGLGIIGVGTSTILACKATLKVEEILDTYEETMDKIEDTFDRSENGDLVGVDYSELDAKKDRLTLKTQTVVQFIKLYGPSATLMGVSIGCILGSYRIMSQRQIALMAAYKLVEEAFSKYRGRVVNELGEAKDGHFMYGTTTVSEENTVIDEDGKKKKISTEKEEVGSGVNTSGFGRIFGPEKPDQMGAWTGSTQWSPVHEYNLSFLQAKEQYFTDKLAASSDGVLVANEVYEELGFPKTEAGRVCGWKYKSQNGDGFVSFRPRGIDGNWAMGMDGDSIILDFNIEGLVYNDAKAVKELKK